MKTFTLFQSATSFMLPKRVAMRFGAIVFCCFAGITSVMSQTAFSIAPALITDTADCGAPYYASTVFISNPGSTDLYLGYTVASNTLPGDACWEYGFCDWNACYPFLPTGTSTPPVPILANDSSSMIFDIVVTNNNKGQGSFVLSIFEVSNPSNSKTVTWSMAGCLTGTECTSGILETSDNNTFIVFPNPSNGFINVEITKGYKPGSSFYIYNIVGEKLMEYAGIKNNKMKMDMTALPAGGYFIKYDDGEGVSVKKFFKTN